MNSRQFALVAIASAALLVSETARALPANAAPTGTASQSSIDPGGGNAGVASRGIDGNRDGNFYHGPVTHTANGDPDPSPGLYEWWDVTLSQPHVFEQIVVFNRTDCCTERIGPFRLSVFSGATSVFSIDVPTFVPDITGVDIAGMTFPLTGQIGDRVRIQLTHQDFLSLAEVEAYATPVPEPSALVFWALGLLGLILTRSRRVDA